MNRDFYTSIEPVDDFEQLASEGVYRPLPDGWLIVAADVANSTVAITAGRYRAVNTIGVAVIAAVRNVTKPVEVPYVFGGDGAILCVPPEHATAARDALASTVSMAREAFDLTLRGAVVPIEYVREIGLDVLVARHRVSEHYVQCGLFGGGATEVEDRMKSGELPPEYVVDGDDTTEADYEGLECRWQEVPSAAEETVAVIVEVDRSDENPLTVYRWVMERTREIYGDAADCRPVVESELRVSLAGTETNHEVALNGWRLSAIRHFLERIKLRLWVAVGSVFLGFGIKMKEVDWSTYRADLVANTDFRKFDGAVRFVLSGSSAQRQELERFLDDLWVSGTLRYGVHVSTSALMTCLIDQRQGDHFHFVDAAGGGYAQAAAHMKSRLPPTP